MARIFFDTNLFIYLIEQHPVFGGAVRELRRRMRQRGDVLVTSAFTVGEVLVKPFRAGDLALAGRYTSYFAKPQIQVAAFDLKAAQTYGRFRADATIKPGDAIQLACAAAAGVDLFITNDDRLTRTVVPGIHFITSLARAPV